MVGSHKTPPKKRLAGGRVLGLCPASSLEVEKKLFSKYDDPEQLVYHRLPYCG
jgi:hypothetical protein